MPAESSRRHEGNRAVRDEAGIHERQPWMPRRSKEKLRMGPVSASEETGTIASACADVFHTPIFPLVCLFWQFWQMCPMFLA